MHEAQRHGAPTGAQKMHEAQPHGAQTGARKMHEAYVHVACLQQKCKKQALTDLHLELKIKKKALTQHTLEWHLLAHVSCNGIKEELKKSAANAHRPQTAHMSKVSACQKF